jgi:hypothetical protein
VRTENQSEQMNFCWVQSAESEHLARIPHRLRTDSEHPLCEDLGHVGNLRVRAESAWSPCGVRVFRADWRGIGGAQ